MVFTDILFWICVGMLLSPVLSLVLRVCMIPVLACLDTIEEFMSYRVRPGKSKWVWFKIVPEIYWISVRYEVKRWWYLS